MRSHSVRKAALAKILFVSTALGGVSLGAASLVQWQEANHRSQASAGHG